MVIQVIHHRTDRVLFCNQSDHLFKPLFYDNLHGPFQKSDHRPVGCYFETSVSEVQQEKFFHDYVDEEHKWTEKYYDYNLGDYDDVP